MLFVVCVFLYCAQNDLKAIDTLYDLYIPPKCVAISSLIYITFGVTLCC